MKLTELEALAKSAAMLDGKDVYRYARRRLGFVTYWHCRVEDTMRNWLVKRDFIRLAVLGVD